jgi:hypothetical protein
MMIMFQLSILLVDLAKQEYKIYTKLHTNLLAKIQILIEVIMKIKNVKIRYLIDSIVLPRQELIVPSKCIMMGVDILKTFISA